MPVSVDPTLRVKLIVFYHESSLGGHSGVIIRMWPIPTCRNLFLFLTRLSKATYFIALKHLYIALDVAQTDGQTEIVNKCLDCYLRCMTYKKPKEWSQWLALAEWWYNTSHHSSINMSPYEVVFKAREATLRALKSHLLRAQTRIKAQAYKGRTTSQKLSAKFFGPFEILAKVGAVAYTLALPSAAKLHPTFHISQLKKKIGSQPVFMTLPVVTSVAGTALP
ncbi:hypothetical protein KY285_036347 [Solanum tuberosum]|nr:hypothetical protein KY285_036347 [Solanum tuberosum]